MSQEIEIEYKNLLTKNEFDDLLKSLPFPEISDRQINYYFETKDFSLKKKMCALRIREKNNAYILTLKQPHSDGLLETNDILTRQEADSWIQGKIIPKPHTTYQLNQLHISPSDLIYYGNLQTDRREIQCGNVLLVLDDSTYNNHSDYELEIEAPTKDMGLNTLHKLLTKYNIEQKHTPSKIERFFSSIRDK